MNYALADVGTNACCLTTVVPAALSNDGELATFAVTTNLPTVAGTLALAGPGWPVLVESISLPAPIITSFALQSNVCSLSGSGPAAQSYHVLAATNAALPVTNWIPVGAGSFTGGVFQFSDLLFSNLPQRFYRLSVP